MVSGRNLSKVLRKPDNYIALAKVILPSSDGHGAESFGRGGGPKEGYLGTKQETAAPLTGLAVTTN
jgi:hypothetical protein